MKILVFSDSHGNTALIEKALGIHINSTDLILHLGDCAADTRIFTKLCPHIANINILGNCDYFSSGYNAVTEAKFDLGKTGFSAFACHGHSYAVKRGTDIIYSKAKAEKASIAFYGHTHIAEISEVNGIIIMNPGSVSLPRGTEPASYGVVNISDNQILPTIIYDR